MQATADLAAEPIAALLSQLKEQLEALPHTKEIGDAEAEAIYALAYREYSQSKFGEALRFFQLLLVYRPTNKVYLLGAALCLKRLRRYDLAVAAFIALQYLDADEPSHTLALAECHLLRHEHAAARETLARVVERCRNSTVHEKVSARAEAMLELMRSNDVPVAV